MLTKPVILVVDDDPQVLAAVRRDLRTRFREYALVSANSGEQAVSTMHELKSRGDALALVISDQRMPGLQGTEVLTRALAYAPRVSGLARFSDLALELDQDALQPRAGSLAADLPDQQAQQRLMDQFDDEYVQALLRCRASSVLQAAPGMALSSKQLYALLRRTQGETGR